MKVLITGVHGFIGKNLVAHLNRVEGVEVLPFGRSDDMSLLASHVAIADFVFHLAGVNRPTDTEEFRTGNADLTRSLCHLIRSTGRLIPVVYTSSIQAALDNPYGVSKQQAELCLQELNDQVGNPVYIYRLPNVFGKWARPNYNSAVATFCHNIAKGRPLQVNDANARISLVYIDDVIESFISLMDGDQQGGSLAIEPQYTISVGDLAHQIEAFRDSRSNMVAERVGTGLTRALYSTYLSYLEPDQFSYEVAQHVDPRGSFVEMLKTKDSGQFSFFTAHPGITRGGHYHHSKNEKFLVISGQACFRFRHIVTGQFHELFTSGENPTVVETVPGWSHDITNVGDTEMVVMLWANEIFDRAKPDTFNLPVGMQP